MRCKYSLTFSKTSLTYNSLELCVGMICASIPSLRPLFVSQESYAIHQDHNLKANRAYKLAPYGNKSQDRLNEPKVCRLSSSTSEEKMKIMPSHAPRQIRKISEVEITREVAESTEERKDNSHNNWNPV